MNLLDFGAVSFSLPYLNNLSCYINIYISQYSSISLPSSDSIVIQSTGEIVLSKQLTKKLISLYSNSTSLLNVQVSTSNLDVQSDIELNLIPSGDITFINAGVNANSSSLIQVNSK